MGLIRINGQPSEPDYVLRNGDYLEHIMHRHEPPAHMSTAPSSSLADDGNPVAPVVHHDGDEVVVVNKPSSIPVHPSGAYLHNSMTLLLQRECAQPELFPVHRLDRLTSGLLMFSKSAAKAKALCYDIASGKVQKYYVARVAGEFPVLTSDDEETEGAPTITRPFDAVLQAGLAQISKTQLNGATYWRLSASIGCVSSADHLQGVIVNETSKSAETLMRKLSFDGTHSVIECLPITGRTHQIRVHLQYLGFPIVNDPLYGPERGVPVPSSEHKSENGGHEVTPVESKSTSEPAVDKQPPSEMGEAAQCESICSACKSGESAIFSVVHQHCFTMWLHSFKYESSTWMFEVPLPPWALMQEAAQPGA